MKGREKMVFSTLFFLFYFLLFSLVWFGLVLYLLAIVVECLLWDRVG